MNKLGLCAFLLVFVGCMWQCGNADTSTSSKAKTQKTSTQKSSTKEDKCVEFVKNKLSSLQRSNGNTYALVDGRLMQNKTFSKNGWKPVGTQNFTDYTIGKGNAIYAVKNTPKVNGYLYKFDGKTWKKMKGSGFAQVISDNNGNLYAIKNTKKLKGAIYSMDNKGNWSKLKNNQFTSMAIDNKNVLYATKDTKNRSGVIYKHVKDSWVADGSSNFSKIGFGQNNQMVGIKKTKNANLLMAKKGDKWTRKNVRNIQDFQVAKNGELVYIRKSDKGLTLMAKCGLSQL